MDNPYWRCFAVLGSGHGLTTNLSTLSARADWPMCRPSAAPINRVSAAPGRRGLGAGPCPPSAAGSEIRKKEIMPTASTDGHQTRTRILTFLIEIAELTAHYSLRQPNCSKRAAKSEARLTPSAAASGGRAFRAGRIREGWCSSTRLG